jgi:hypothetical protein
MIVKGLPIVVFKEININKNNYFKLCTKQKKVVCQKKKEKY